MNSVSRHYAISNIVSIIREGLGKLGKSPEEVTVDDLSAADEFHMGGRPASDHFFPKLEMKQGEHWLDLGAGIGGGSRYAADRFGVNVTGIDLTPEYVDAGRELTEWVTLEDRVNLEVGDATSLEFSDGTFDGAFTMHVLMNVKEKTDAFREVFRVLKPGACFGIYDVVNYGEGDFRYPVPWAGDSSTSFLSTPDEYRTALESVGFTVESIEDRHEFAVEFFEMVRAKMASAEGPPPLGIHVLMGADARAKVQNLTANLIDGLVAPFEIISRKS